MSEEYITKNQALTMIMAVIEGDESEEVLDALQRASDNITALPCTDVAPVVHGHWSKEMRFTEDFMGNRTYGYKCSVCGKLANRLQFCGNCGAKMDESEE
ncbi:MAG: hypothetical protein J6N15_04125 [Ruminiclostridium sp.]|nr:hypothetical protein [Ruminiclostridium sp.]